MAALHQSSSVWFDQSVFTPPFQHSQGVFKGVTTIFFSFVGFDMVASMAEEAHNPAVDLPIGIIGSVSVATAIYIAMSTVLTGVFCTCGVGTGSDTLTSCPLMIYSNRPSCCPQCLSAGMVNYVDLDPDAPFAVAFSDKNMEWAAKIVSIGAIFGRLTALLLLTALHGRVNRAISNLLGLLGTCGVYDVFILHARRLLQQ